MKSQRTTVFEQSPNLGQWDLSQWKAVGITEIDTQAKVSPYEVPPSEVLSSELPRSASRVPMWHFVADGKRVLCTRPVEVEITEEDDGFVAACERLHIFAHGSTYEEAVEDFKEQVVHFCQKFKDSGEDEMIGRGLEIRELYQRYFDMEQ